MNKLFLTLAIMLTVAFSANAQYKKDGTPDMRYSQNKQTYGNSYSNPSSSYGTNSDIRYQNGYIKDNGTYVEPHYKTNTNNTNLDNFSTKDNYNPYNGNSGSRAKDYSNYAYNYGSGQQIHTGSRGGQYYINSIGNKTYVPKRNGW
ncbi:MAG: hypothetical protein IPO14_08525 [Saprospiraceae bacterium]|nr:hypothetical protein [Saprospiraceae bacterium]